MNVTSGKERLVWLSFGGFLGAFLAFGDGLPAFLVGSLTSQFPDAKGQLVASAVFLMLSLPTLFLLWCFRTHDTREQIKKTQENINASLLGINLNLLVSEQLEARCIGLTQLVAMKHQGLFEKEVDFATRNIVLTKLDKTENFLEIAHLQNVDLHRVDFSGANLQGAVLFVANLNEAKLERANLRKAKLPGADLCRAVLRGANLQDAYMSGVNMIKADMRGANLQGVNLCGADLQEVNLEKANLLDADLQGADLRKANLCGANLHGAKFSPGIDVDYLIATGELPADQVEAKINLVERIGPAAQKTQLAQAIFDDMTKFPEGFDPEKADMDFQWEDDGGI